MYPAIFRRSYACFQLVLSVLGFIGIYIKQNPKIYLETFRISYSLFLKNIGINMSESNHSLYF